MKTEREIYSEIINDLKAISVDLWVSPRWVLNKAKDVLGNFLKKDNDANNNLYKLSEGWIEINGLALEEVPVTTCDIGNTCIKLMRTKDKIPDTYSSRFGNVIRQVASEDFSNFYEPTTPKGWKNIQKRKDKSGKKYYFFIGQKLYIPIPKGQLGSPESIRLEAYFYRPWEADKVKVNCPTCKKNCKSPLDYIFVSPEYLLDDVKKEVTKQINQWYLRTIVDPYPNTNPLDKQPPQQK